LQRGRKKLRDQGYDDVAIERLLPRARRLTPLPMTIDELARRDHSAEAAAHQARLARQELELAGLDGHWVAPADDGYKPTRVDPLRVGPARVTKTTATAANRKKAMTRHEHHQYEQRNGTRG
jgi:hypothetical protein